MKDDLEQLLKSLSGAKDLVSPHPEHTAVVRVGSTSTTTRCRSSRVVAVTCQPLATRS